MSFCLHTPDITCRQCAGRREPSAAPDPRIPHPSAVNEVVVAILRGVLTVDERAELRAALGHTDCVPVDEWAGASARADAREAALARAEAERDRLHEAIRAHRDGYHETLGMADVEARDTRRGELDAVLWAALDGEVSA